MWKDVQHGSDLEMYSRFKFIICKIYFSLVYIYICKLIDTLNGNYFPIIFKSSDISNIIRKSNLSHLRSIFPFSSNLGVADRIFSFESVLA